MHSFRGTGSQFETKWWVSHGWSFHLGATAVFLWSNKSIDNCPILQDISYSYVLSVDIRHYMVQLNILTSAWKCEWEFLLRKGPGNVHDYCAYANAQANVLQMQYVPSWMHQGSQAYHGVLRYILWWRTSTCCSMVSLVSTVLILWIEKNINLLVWNTYSGALTVGWVKHIILWLSKQSCTCEIF